MRRGEITIPPNASRDQSMVAIRSLTPQSEQPGDAILPVPHRWVHSGRTSVAAFPWIKTEPGGYRLWMRVWPNAGVVADPV